MHAMVLVVITVLIFMGTAVAAPAFDQTVLLDQLARHHPLVGTRAHGFMRVDPKLLGSQCPRDRAFYIYTSDKRLAAASMNAARVAADKKRIAAHAARMSGVWSRALFSVP